MATSKDLQVATVTALMNALEGDEPPTPQTIAASVSYLKAFPPDGQPVGREITDEEQQRIDEAAAKIVKFQKRREA